MRAFEGSLGESDDEREGRLHQRAGAPERHDPRGIVELEREALRDQQREDAVEGGDRESGRHRSTHRAGSGDNGHGWDRESGGLAGQGAHGGGDADQRRDAELPPKARAGGGLEGYEPRD